MLMHKRYDQLLEQLENLLPIDQVEPDRIKVIEWSLKKTVQDVANYLNIPVDELPEELDYTIVAMTAQLIQTHDWLESDNSNGNVQSLSEGDTSVTFKSLSDVYSELQSVNAITDNYTNILNNFRRLPK